MKRSTKFISIILIFFLIIAIVIIGRTMIGNHFKKKFSKRPPPGIIITQVTNKEFYEKNIVFSCGSGVTACVLALAYSLINDKYHPCIYDGSWAEYGII